MSKRSEDWMAEMGHLLPKDEETKALVLSGDIEICPVCGEMSAYAWDLCNAYDVLPEGDTIPGGFKPDKGTVAHIGVASGLGEWQCGHCHRHLVESDSPLNHPCYTHSDD